MIDVESGRDAASTLRWLLTLLEDEDEARASSPQAGAMQGSSVTRRRGWILVGHGGGPGEPDGGCPGEVVAAGSGSGFWIEVFVEARFLDHLTGGLADAVGFVDVSEFVESSCYEVVDDGPGGAAPVATAIVFCVGGVEAGDSVFCVVEDASEVGHERGVSSWGGNTGIEGEEGDAGYSV